MVCLGRTIQHAKSSWCVAGVPWTSPINLDFSPLGTSPVARIEGAQNRAVTLSQLRRVRDFILSHAAEDGLMQWTDLAPPQYSPTSGQALNKNTINLYAVFSTQKQLVMLS